MKNEAQVANVQLSVALFVMAGLAFVTAASLLVLVPASVHSLLFVLSANFAVFSATTGGCACARVARGAPTVRDFSYQGAHLYFALGALLGGAVLESLAH